MLFSNYLDSRHLVFALLQRNYKILDIFYNLFLQFVFLFFIPNVVLFEIQRVPLWGGLVVFEVKFRNLDF